MYTLITILVLIVLFLASAIRVLAEYERGVIFRLGRIIGAKGPGLIILIPVIDRMVKISLRLIALDVPPQDVITRDNVSVKVNAVIYFRVMEPVKAVIEVENYLYATSQLAQTTLRSVCGEAELDELLSEREKINMKLQDILDKHTDPWGGTSKAIKRKLIFTILSITGMRIIKPGPFAPIMRPRRKITPLSYSANTLMALARNRTISTKIVIKVYIIPSCYFFLTINFSPFTPMTSTFSPGKIV